MSMVETSSGNVYADLRHPTAKAMLAKAQLVTAMTQAIEAKGITLDHAARLMGVPLDELSKLMAGQFQGRSTGELERMHKEVQQCRKI
ncbi:XRE family transcriptional regulator [Pseudomonas syringae]|uniref:XRE family transcriptional regulator n=1 Tax=Pseudomonas syringae TaxID=317 RepID=UPI001F07F114|nr:XRE family transcriptional regulator [Pseudomonas syringae]